LEEYNEDDDVQSVTSTTAARVKETRGDFDAIMDEFLGSYKVLGKKMVKNTNGTSSGMAQLDEMRKQLGKARIS
jgi:protein LTV1